MIEKKNIHIERIFERHRDVLIGLCLVMATLAVYWPVQEYDFINYDDPQYVTENRYVKSGLTSESVAWAFTAFYAFNWHPVTWLSHMLDWELFGLNAGMHHLTNLFFHILNTLLLFIVLKKMTQKTWRSGIVAALFALHPLHVESVAWISERKDVLSTFFWMLTMWSYTWYIKHPGIYRYLIVVIFFVIGLMAKPMLVTLPFVLLLLDYWPLARFEHEQSEAEGNSQLFRVPRGVVLEKVPFFAIAVISSVVTFFAQKHGGAVRSLDVISITDRVNNALISYVAYMGKMIWPSKLAVLYPYFVMLPWWKVVGACVIVAGISFVVIRVVKKFPYLAVGWFWYIGTLVPVIGLVQIGSQAMADRYTYIPFIGVFIIISWGVYDLTKRWCHKKMVLGTAAIASLLVLMIISSLQIGYWRNSITLYEHTIAVTSKNSVPHNNLANFLQKQGQIDEAVKHYRIALSIRPDYEEAHLNLGNVLEERGQVNEAIGHYLEALRINPDYPKAYNNMGNVLQAQGRIDEAIKYYKKALQTKPDFAEAHLNLGNALGKQGRIDEAIKQNLEALRINPDYAKAHNNLGIYLFGKKDIQGSMKHFQEALRIKPDYEIARRNLKRLLEMQKTMQ